MFLPNPNQKRDHSGNDISDDSDLASEQRKTHQEIIRGCCNFAKDHLIDSRLASEESLSVDGH